MQDVLPAFGLNGEEGYVEPFGSGLINLTWKVSFRHNAYILQKVNHKVFPQPEILAHNHQLIADYLRKYYPDYVFVAPVATVSGDAIIYWKNEGYFRLFPFVSKSHSKDVVETPEQAFEAAQQFGRFTRMLSGMDASNLGIPIPQFHDLELRYNQFLHALQHGNQERIKACRELIDSLQSYQFIVETYRFIKSNPAFKLRVTHHDTKISNVLFDDQDQGLCVIDLDTVMPGYFISDVGDMMRTYLSSVSEEECDLSKVQVREEFYKAVVEGYYSEMSDQLTEIEKQYFFYAGEFIIYMQALRFLTDHINNDVYYGARYEGHNLIRAANQHTLLEQLISKKNILKDCITLL